MPKVCYSFSASIERFRRKSPDAATIEHQSKRALCHTVQLSIFPQLFFILLMNILSTMQKQKDWHDEDAKLYRQILCSRNVSAVGKELREEMAVMTKNLLTKYYHPDLLNAYIAFRFIPLDKNPGVRPTGVGEVLRRIIGKTVTWSLKAEIKEKARPLQTCAEHRADAKAAIRTMREIYENDAMDAVLMIGAKNAFSWH